MPNPLARLGMTRDSNVLKRDLFVIPGGLLSLYGFLGLLYVLFWRSEETPCSDSYRFLLSGACYNVLPLLVVLLLVGLALLLVGILVFRGRVERLEGLLHAGTPTHFGLAFLISLAVVPGLAALAMRGLERSSTQVFATMVGDTPVKTVAILAAIAVLGLLMLVPYSVLLLSQVNRRRRFLHEARRVVPSAPGEASGDLEDEEPAPAYAEWPEAR